MTAAGRPGVTPGRTEGDPFRVLGLDASAPLTDDDVRAAWRRIAAASHPDRADGGDPDRFAAAAAGYTALRTPSGRGEARADLAAAASDLAGRDGEGPFRLANSGRMPPPPIRLAARISRGRPVLLLARIMVAAAIAVLGILAAGASPAGLALAVGAATWLIVTARRDLTRR